VREKTQAQQIAALWRNRARHLNQRARVHGAEGHLSGTALREIVRRDGSACAYCDVSLDYEQPRNGGVGLTSQSATFDHIIRLVDGGSNTPANVCCSCRGCNQRNAKRSLEDPTGEAIERLRRYLARKPHAPASEVAA
jgi:hypothetical protein